MTEPTTEDIARMYPPAPEEQPSWGETFSAGVQSERLRLGSWNRRQRVALSVYQEMEAELGADPENTWLDRNAGGRIGPSDQMVARMTDRAASRGTHPAERSAQPSNVDAFQEEVNRRLQEEYAEAQDLLADTPEGTWLPQFLGGLWAGASDESTVAMLPFGGGGGFVKRVGTEALLGGAAEYATMGRQTEMADSLGIDAPNPVRQTLEASAISGALGGILFGTGRLVNAVRGRGQSGTPGRPNDADEITHEQRVDDAAQDLQTDRLPEPDPDGASDIEGPAFIGEMLGAIRQHEAAGNYNIVYSGIPAHLRPPVELTRMSVREVREWQRRIDPQVNSEAAGAYQIMPDTLDYLIERLGLTGDELFDEAMQDRLGYELMRRRGLDDFVAGRISAQRFAHQLSQEWAALPRMDGTGRSFYDGYNGNSASASEDMMLAILGGTFDGTWSPGAVSNGSSGVSLGWRTGRPTTGRGQVTAGDDLTIDVEYEVIDAGRLSQASGDLQPRDRSRSSSDEQVAEIAARLDPRRLGPAPEADRGAPIVGPDNVIESGNGRVLALQRAAQRHPDRFGEYRSYIEELGFNIPSDVQTPILVARRKTDFSDEHRQAFVRSANTSAVARMSPTERAASDAGAMTDDILELFDGTQALGAAGNRAFTTRALEALPQAERSGLVTASGRLNREGEARLRAALFARAFDAPDVIARHSELSAGDMGNLIEALEDAAPAWAALRADIDAGRVLPQFDITAELMDAVRMIGNARAVARREGGAAADLVKEMLNDIDLFEGAVSPITAALVKRFVPNGRTASHSEIGSFLKRYAEEARKVGDSQDGLFGEAPNVAQVLRAVEPEIFKDLPDLPEVRPEANPSLQWRENGEALEGFNDGAKSEAAQGAAASYAEKFAEPDRVMPEDLRQPGQIVRLAELPGAQGKALEFDLKLGQQIKSIEDLVQRAEVNHETLTGAIARAANDIGVEQKPAKVKGRARIEEKVADKYRGEFDRITDVARGGVSVRSPDEAEAFVDALSKSVSVIDEGWSATPQGYLDRKLTVVFPDGQLGEVQIWPSQMLDAKSAGGGHAQYKVFRAAETSPADRQAANQKMQEIYTAARSDMGASWAGIDAPSARTTASNSAGSTSGDPSSSRTSDGLPIGPQDRSSPSDRIDPSSSSAAGILPSTRNNRIGDTSTADIGDLTAEFNGDTELELPDGTRTTIRDIIEDLEADEELAQVLEACNIGRAA